MAVWRCPHCSTPQAEASRCWVCRRSTTSCASCRHYRRAVAGDLGLCGLDPRRLALRGTEMRPCWVAPDPTPDLRAPVPAASLLGHARGDGDGRATRTFVPVEELRGDPRRASPPVAGEVPVPATGTPGPRVPGAWWLWGDPEPWDRAVTAGSPSPVRGRRPGCSGRPGRRR